MLTFFPAFNEAKCNLGKVYLKPLRHTAFSLQIVGMPLSWGVGGNPAGLACAWPCNRCGPFLRIIAHSLSPTPLVPKIRGRKVKYLVSGPYSSLTVPV